MDNVIKSLERFEELLLFLNSEDFVAEADQMGHVEEWDEFIKLKAQIMLALNHSEC